MSVTPNINQNVAQLIDANLDRAREGLRAIEDWCRFGLKEKEKVITIKNWRHLLSQQHLEIYKRARSASNDKGAGLNHPAQEMRDNPKEIVAANFGRVQEALRVIEEFSRLSNPDLSKLSSEIRYLAYDLELNIIKSCDFNSRVNKIKSCKICLITKPHKEIAEIVLSAINAGVKMIQYRCKTGSDIENLAIAKELSLICKTNKSLLIINDRLDIALASDADGVHLGQEDIPVSDARKIIGDEKLIGLSTHSIEQVQIAQEQSCDYIGLGPIYPTNSKIISKSIGTDFLNQLQKTNNIPLFAIGGINKDNISEVVKAGAKRVAVINAIMAADDSYLASKELMEQLNK